MVNIFKPAQALLCPYCLTEIKYRDESKLDACPNPVCKKDLPRQYVLNYHQAPPFFVQMIGWSTVGKTVYLQALTYTFRKLNRLWSNFACFPITMETLRFENNADNFGRTGEVPPSTQMKLLDAYISVLRGMDIWGHRTLVVRDVAGEVFAQKDNIDFNVGYMPYLLHVPVTMMMISLYDLEIEGNKRMNNLMNGYITTLVNNARNFGRGERRKVVVILTKADTFMDRLPQELYDALMNDPVGQVLNGNGASSMGINMDAYMSHLRNLSGKIQRWLEHEYPEARQLYVLARDFNIDLEYTVVSSLGGAVDPDSPGLKVNISPYRILDPFLWALEMQCEVV